MGYALYFKKEENAIEIKTDEGLQIKSVLEERIGELEIYSMGEIVNYNTCYFIANNKEILVKRADKMKEYWIDEKKKIEIVGKEI